MGTGIHICGLNGCGKSTLGRALAARLGFRFIDNEDLYFPRREPDGAYSNPRTREEAEKLLLEQMQEHPDFVFAAVRGNYAEEICSRYDYAIVLEVPREIRSHRLRSRSFRQFGSRMLEGGDLYEQEQAFFRMAHARRDEDVEDWLRTLTCPVIRLDGTKPIGENVEQIIRLIK